MPIKHLLQAICLLALVSSAGCGLKDAIDDAKDNLDDLEDMLNDEVTEEELLAELFPDLSAEEIAELSAEFTLEDLLALESELEAAREAAAELSEALFIDAEAKVEEREETLAEYNGGFPETVSAVNTAGFFDASGDCRIDISGVLRNDASVQIADDNIAVTVDGAPQSTETTCLYDGTPVDIVFLLDITGSMGSVIRSVRESVVRFVDAVATSGLTGTVGVVTFQDTVGVNYTFQEPVPSLELERSPFFEPVSISDTQGISDLKQFVSRLEANQGDDIPENLTGAIDFARNNVIGYRGGEPNVIGAGNDDPPATEPGPSLKNERQVFIAMTDATFHSDSRTASNASLLSDFIPRDIETVVASLNKTGTIVNVSDPSWVDETTAPDGSEAEVDADYYAINTGGVGEDLVAGYSLVDLELVVVANDTGLLDITLDRLLETTCRIEFTNAAVTADTELTLSIQAEGEIFTESIFPIQI